MQRPGIQKSIFIAVTVTTLVLLAFALVMMGGLREILGTGPTLTGFYSYGEISPFTSDGKCELHNQTMTITTFSER